MTIAAIDGDELAYKISSKYQNTYYGVYKDDTLLWKCLTRDDAIESIVLTEDEDLDIRLIYQLKESNGYKRKITDAINSILNNTKCDEYIICLSGDKNFRYDIATLMPYKGNRDGTIKPGYFLEFKDFLLNNHPSMRVDHLEADDLLTHLGYQNDKVIICSTDKDLRTVESLNYNISTQKLQRINKTTALYNFYYQLLIGDSTDNIPWPYNLGKITAAKILEDVKGSEDPSEYMTHLYPYYVSYLVACNKNGEYKTKWFNDDLCFKDILWEIGNLIYMHRTLDIEERWELPEFKDTLDAKEKINESEEERELVLLESQSSEKLMEE
jgi:rRNA-processing protein FCF1